MCIKIHRDINCSLVAICDQELLNKTFREGKLKLEVTKDFYGGSSCSIGEAVILINNTEQANLVGNKIIKEAVRNKLIDPRAVIYIDGIPHVQIMKLDLLHDSKK